MARGETSNTFLESLIGKKILVCDLREGDDEYILLAFDEFTILVKDPKIPDIPTSLIYKHAIESITEA